MHSVQGQRSFRHLVVLSLLCPLLCLFLPSGSRAEQSPAVTEAAVASSAADGLEEFWYTVSIGEVSAGHMLIRQERQGGKLTTETELEMTLSRGSFEQKLGMSGRFTETEDGQPIEAMSRQSMGQQPTETLYEFTPEEIVIRRRQGDTEMEDRVPLPTDWRTPGQADALLLAALQAGEEELTVRTIDPLLGSDPVEIVWKRELVEAQVEAGGKVYATTRWRQSQSSMPGIVSTVDVDAEGHMVQTRTPMMGLEMVLTRSSRQVALGEHGAPELLLQTFIRPNRPIERARELQRGVYALSLPEGSMPGLPSFGDQITAAEDGRVIVTVELGSSPKLDSDRLDTAPYLRSSLYANLEDPALVALRQKATQDVAPEPALRAEALRAFANSYLDQKDLGSLFATASEVVVNRSGDCTEHAVLLMALLRSEGIPARVVTGLVYADSFAGAADIFGYHMWTQALLEGRWIDLDATLQKRYDATHIAFAATPLNREGDATKDLAQVMQLAGELKVEILQTGYKAEAE